MVTPRRLRRLRITLFAPATPAPGIGRDLFERHRLREPGRGDANAAGELIIPKIGNAIKRNVAGADPEYQQILRNNIILSGGGSLIDCIADRVATEIADIGDVRVWCVEDPINSVAAGALKLASEMPDDMYTSIN